MSWSGWDTKGGRGERAGDGQRLPGARGLLVVAATGVQDMEYTLPLLHRDRLTRTPEQAPPGLFTKRT
ncbi:hypothetical protein [Streptomyces sp. NPDC054783]